VIGGCSVGEGILALGPVHAASNSIPQMS